MGGSQSKKDAPSLDKTEQEIVTLMMPVYYNDEALTNAELDLANNTWKMILTNTSPEFLNLSKDPNFSYPNCIMYFYNCFYERLFDIHPLAKDLFKDMNSQGKFLVKMISLALSEKADPDKYEKTLIKLAEIHNDRGVKAIEYGLVGEVLFWSIRKSIGPVQYTMDVHEAWIKIYSRMLKTMVPVAVAHELRNGSAQEKRFFAHNNNIGLSEAEESVLNNMTQSKQPAVSMHGVKEDTVRMSHDNASISLRPGENTAVRQT